MNQSSGSDKDKIQIIQYTFELYSNENYWRLFIEVSIISSYDGGMSISEI